MSLHDYLGIKFWLDIIATVIGFTALAVLIIYDWWHDR